MAFLSIAGRGGQVGVHTFGVRGKRQTSETGVGGGVLLGEDGLQGSEVGVLVVVS